MVFFPFWVPEGLGGSFPSKIPILDGAADSLFVMGSPRAPYARAAPPGADRPHKQGEIMAVFSIFRSRGSSGNSYFSVGRSKVQL